LKPGDLLFQRGNTIEYVGIAAVYDGPSNKYIYPDLMIRVRTAYPILTEWIWRAANSPIGRKYMSANATGTAGTMPKISGEILRNFPVPLPPIAEATEILRRVTDALAASDDALTALDAEAADAARLKQSILKAAFEGRLVPQDATDEPASALLARLVADRSEVPAKRGRTKSARS
jgi:type I restriction enzyme S subunit